MNRFAAWARQPSTVVGIGMFAAVATYWFTNDARMAALAFGAICAGITDHSAEIAKAQADLARIERIEDALRPAAPLPVPKQ